MLVAEFNQYMGEVQVDTPYQLPQSSPWRDDFPTLNTEVYGQPLVYLDTAATAQTPQSVIDRMTHFYQHEYANVHRGVHQLSVTATDQMEKVRGQVAHFLQAGGERQIIFTKGTTESINLVANTYLKSRLQAGDEIIVTEMEHHANLVPWQMLAQEKQLILKVWPITESGELAIEDLHGLISERTKFLAVTQVSNVIGTVNPVKNYITLAHQHQIPVLVDGAQAVLHQTVNVTELDCDFYVFSGHKLYGPTGIGILYAKPERLEQMPPWEGGGAMIKQVHLPTGTTYNRAPWCFEAGTPNIAGILGLGAAITYLEQIGMPQIHCYETQLLQYTLEQLRHVEGLELYGAPRHQSGAIAFNLGSHHAYDVGTCLDRYGIAIRTGHHCAMPLLQRLGQHAVCRASIGLYTNQTDIDRLLTGIHRVTALLE